MSQSQEQYIRTGANVPNRPGKPIDINALLAMLPNFNNQQQVQQQPIQQPMPQQDAIALLRSIGMI